MGKNGRRKRWGGTRTVPNFSRPVIFYFEIRHYYPNRSYPNLFTFILFPRTRMGSMQEEEEWVWIRATSNRRHFDLWLENGNLALESHENKPWGRFLGTVQTASNGYPIFFLGYMTVWINFEKCRHSVNKFNYPFFSFFLLRENNITRNITRSSYRRIMFCEKRMEVIFKGKNGNYDFILFTWWRIKTDVMCGYGKFYVALQAIINLQRWINNGRVY